MQASILSACNTSPTLIPPNQFEKILTFMPGLASAEETFRNRGNDMPQFNLPPEQPETISTEVDTASTSLEDILSPSSYPISRTSEECCPFLSLPRPACVFPDPSLSPTLRSLKERARSERIAAGILRHFLLHAIFRHGWAGIFAGNPGLRPESSLVPSFQ